MTLARGRSGWITGGYAAPKGADPAAKCCWIPVPAQCRNLEKEKWYFLRFATTWYWSGTSGWHLSFVCGWCQAY